MEQPETLTDDERRELEGCYRCACSGCTRRRELIHKALRIMDRALEPYQEGRMSRLELAAAAAIPTQHGCNSAFCPRCRALRLGYSLPNYPAPGVVQPATDCVPKENVPLK